MKRFFVRNFSDLSSGEILPYSLVKNLRKSLIRSNKNVKKSSVRNEETKENVPEPAPIVERTDYNQEYRENEVQIQMLSKTLYEQIFDSKTVHLPDRKLVEKCLHDLKSKGIVPNSSRKLPDVNIKLPKLLGTDLIEHFHEIAEQQCTEYKRLISKILTEPPKRPERWSEQPGWTCYANPPRSVDYPPEDVLIFDVEVCMSMGKAPTLACAVGPDYWYSWISPIQFSDNQTIRPSDRYELRDLIPVDNPTDPNRPKLIIGHNVSYDRARIRDQYRIEGTGTRFLDTLSMHVCVSGVTSYQRAMLKSNKELSDDDIEWGEQTSLNSLIEVYRLYCGKTMTKDARNIFVDGSLSDVRDNLQGLLSYCAGDVIATGDIFRQLYPMFSERFPHPATLAGMLELGMAYLPVNSNWNRYINEANLTYEDLHIEAKCLLERCANTACRLMHTDTFRRHLWMWDQDWSVKMLKMKRPVKQPPYELDDYLIFDVEQDSELITLRDKFIHLFRKKSLLPARRPLLPGYPAWYRKLCRKPTELDWEPGAQDIGTGMQVAPKLLSLCWEGYPLHYIRGEGWGFLIPNANDYPDGHSGTIPIVELIKKCPVPSVNNHATESESQTAFDGLQKNVESDLNRKDFYSKAKRHPIPTYKGTGVWSDIELDGCCWFLRLPHKNGVNNHVGNPLSKDFVNKFAENVLTGDDHTAKQVIKIAKMLSYWRNNRDRIQSQMVVWTDPNRGAIIPQVVVCGTLTRRAMEPTWMTASNAQSDRVGSELRAMVQAPPGYRMCGADVDSQELWIASVLGDSSVGCIHGGTPFGWMTLSGTKADGKDMHSVTAKAVGISRDHAKVLNYARIYGAGQRFAERLLKQFNPTISDGEAKSKAWKMFALTKGRKLYYPVPEYENDIPASKGYTSYEALKLAATHRRPVNEMFTKPKWYGGTESAMFNKLEEIAGNEYPVTPFLLSRLSRALEPHTESTDRFLPTRINWVVQSGAVDFLHLMFVCMRWLMGPHIRFCLSFHDEIRYLVADEYADRAALALHITNLLTRSFCAKRIGFNDLPQSIAFFTSVELDTVLRKEAHLDCRTPSNLHGLVANYGIKFGESIDILTAIERGGNDLTTWQWHSA